MAPQEVEEERYEDDFDSAIPDLDAAAREQGTSTGPPQSTQPSSGQPLGADSRASAASLPSHLQQEVVQPVQDEVSDVEDA